MARNTDWLRKRRWGVFCHYLCGPELSADAWNRRVDAFDVRALADQLKRVGAGYFFLTIGQNSGHFCSPNATYDRLTGIAPSKCSRRDLMLDLAEELQRRDIAAMAYLPAGAPAHDKQAMAALQWEWGFKGPWPQCHGGPTTGNRLAEFQRHWEAIIREWSTRWGRKVRGWWIDGCYFADDMYKHADEPNWHSFAAALRSGNADSLLAFNPGVQTPVIVHSPEDDFTAGEIDYRLPASPWKGDILYQILSFLGPTWGAAPSRFNDDLARGFTRYIIDQGGVITWDVPITEGGTIPDAFVAQLAAIGKACG